MLQKLNPQLSKMMYSISPIKPRDSSPLHSLPSSIGRRTGELLRDFSGGIEMGNALLAGRV